jgi:hypothetical protein
MRFVFYITSFPLLQLLPFSILIHILHILNCDNDFQG